MTSPVEWLPPLTLFQSHNGNWQSYIAEVYGFFKQDFVDSLPLFRSTRMRLKWWPTRPAGLEATFWHMVQEGDMETERTPDLRRCERIRWPRPVIEHESDDRVRVWEEERRGENRIHLWFEQEAYLVVIAQRQGYYIPWTAYWVEQQHQREKLSRRWKKFGGEN